MPWQTARVPGPFPSINSFIHSHIHSHAMSKYAEAIRQQLSSGPTPAKQLVDNIGVSQPTTSRALAALGDDVVRLGAARSIQYALRDRNRGFGDLPVYRVDADGLISHIGELVPVRPEGYVMFRTSGEAVYSEGLPWWLHPYDAPGLSRSRLCSAPR